VISGESGVAHSTSGRLEAEMVIMSHILDPVEGDSSAFDTYQGPSEPNLL
jgi:hypothetical protein